MKFELMIMKCIYTKQQDIWDKLTSIPKNFRYI